MAGASRKPAYIRRREAWREVLFDLRGEASEQKAQRRLEMLESWRKDHWGFLTARDIPEEGAECTCAGSLQKIRSPFASPGSRIVARVIPPGQQHVLTCEAGGRPIVWTVDERADLTKEDELAVKPFPSDKEYLHEIADELWAYRMSLIDKIRQKYISTLSMLEIFWFSAFNEERETFVSRVTIESAAKLLNDKIRKVHEYLPVWVQQAIPITGEPKDVVTFKESGSTVTGVAQNFAVSAGRGPTASLLLVDEAAFQDFFGEIYRAVLPMAARLWAVSTANIGNPGAQAFKDLIFEGRPKSVPGWVPVEQRDVTDEDDPAPDPEEAQTVEYRRGLWAYTSPKGIRIIVLRLGADPADTPEWIEEARRPYTRKDWRREMEGDWSTPAGDPYFPIFSEIGREKYVHMATTLLKGPVYMSLDFGRRFPAATFFQYSAPQHRVFGYREFMPHDIQTHEFRDALRYLAGLLPFDTLPDRAKFWIDVYAKKASGAHCPPPWFPPGTRIIAIGGKEANQSQSNADSKDESVAAEIFAAGGLPLTIVSPRVLGRNRIVDQMLMLRPDGWPGTFLDPQMEEVIEGFEGAFAYPPPTKAVPRPDKPRDDNYYINLLDAWGYGIVAVAPEEMPPQQQPERVIGYRGRTPVVRRPLEPGVEEVGWKETRRFK